MLEQRFRDSRDKSLITLGKQTYTIQDVQRGRNPVDYVKSKVLLNRSLETTRHDYSPVVRAHLQIKRQLRCDLQPLNEQSTIDSLIAELKHAEDRLVSEI